MKIDFSKDLDFDSTEPLSCYLNDEKLVFIEYENYAGPCTMQLLPNGGILSTFNYEIIIQVANGMLGVTKLSFRGETYTSKEFIEKYEDLPLINEVLI